MEEKGDIANLQEQLEYLFVRVVVAEYKEKKLSIPEIKQSAKEFLSIEPFTSVEDAREKINNFVASHPKFSVLKEYSDIYYDEERIEEKIETMRKHLKENNVEEALKLVENHGN